MEVKSIVEVILQYGGLGAVLLVVGWAYFKKDTALVQLNKDMLTEQQKRTADGQTYATAIQTMGNLYAAALQAEQQKRIEDAKMYAKFLQEEQVLRIDDAKQNLALAMKLQESVLAAVNKLSDIVDVFEKREAARERRMDEHRG